MANVENCQSWRWISLPNDSKQDSMETFLNEAVRGKPYLDIDRVITEGVSAYAEQETKTKEI